MLNLEIKKNQEEGSLSYFVSTRKISIWPSLEALIQINFSDKWILNILENKIVDTILTFIWKNDTIYNSFSVILKQINKELLKVSGEFDLNKLNIFLWIIENDKLYFSALWSYQSYLVKWDKIENITEWAKQEWIEFSYVLSWELASKNQIFLSNVDLLSYLTKDDLIEISNLSKNTEKLETINNFLIRDISDKSFDIVVLESGATSQIKETKFEKYSKYIWYVKNMIESEKTKKIVENLKENEKIVKLKWIFKIQIEKILEITRKNKKLRVGLFTSWILVSILLLYLIISGIIFKNWQWWDVPEVYKNKLIEAKQIIESTKWDVWNKEAFDKNIKKAEDIIFEVRDKQFFLTDINKMLGDISTLKKQVNWIESIELKQEHKQYSFKNTNFNLNWIFENTRNLYFIWKESIIWPFVEWVDPKEYKYSDWEETVSATINGDWYIFILTKSNRILSFYKGNFKYETVEWQKTWEPALKIRNFNWNLYTLATDWKQIYKHKPLVNWFTNKAEFWDSKDFKQKIIDIYIDWWIYTLKDDLTLDKIILWVKPEKRSIIINWLPDNYTVIDNSKTELIWNINLNYLYILLNNKIWIFEPDSRAFKDVKSIRYVWQIEPSNTRINSIYVPKDWTIYIWDNSAIYKINFEVSNGKVITR